MSEDSEASDGDCVEEGGLVTLVLTDIENSTPLWDRAPQAMSRSMMKHDALVTAAVARHGGRLVKSRGEGDSTFSVYETASAALAASLAMQEAICGTDWPVQAEIHVRIGVHTGRVEQRGDDFAGAEISRAARLRALAQGDQILVSERALAAAGELGPTVTVLPIGPRALRGFSGSERVCEVRRRTGDAALILPLAHVVTDAASAVGRKSELSVLERAWIDAAEGELRLVIVGGEAGVGKSTLVDAFTCSHRDALVMVGRCSAESSSGIVGALEPLTTHCPDNLLGVLTGAGRRHLATVFPNLRGGEGVSGPVGATEFADPSDLVDAIARLILAASRFSPVLLVLEDVHALDALTAMVLQWALSAPLGRILVVATYRSDEGAEAAPRFVSLLADAKRSPTAERLVLQGLPPADVETYVCRALGVLAGPRASRLADELARATNGNALFLAEALRELQGSAAVKVDDDELVWVAPGAVAGGVPTSVSTLVDRRETELSARARRAITAAAVVGESFSVEVVTRLPSAGIDVDEVLEGLNEAEGARVVESIAAGEYRFRHGLFRDVLMTRLDDVGTRRLHREVGEAMWPPAPDDVEGFADHLWKGGVRDERLVPALRRAAEHAVRRLAFDDVLVHAERALGLPCSAADRHDLALVAASAHMHLGAGARSRSAILAIVPSLLADGDPESWTVAAARYIETLSMASGDSHAVDLAEAALARIRADDPRRRAVVTARLADFKSWAAGEGAAAADLARSAVELARISGDLPTLGLCLGVLYRTLHASPSLPERLNVCNELIDVGESCDDDSLRVQGLWARVAVGLVAGDRPRLDEDLRSLLAIAEPRLWARPLGIGRRLQALVALIDGAVDDAERLAADALRWSGDDGDAMAAFQAQTLFVLRERGALQEVVPLLEAAHGSDPDRVIYKVMLTLLLSEAGDTDAAAGHLRQLVADGFAAIPRDATWPTMLFSLGEVAVRCDAVDLAVAIHDQLVPYGGQFLILGVNCTPLGPVDRALAGLAALVGDSQASNVLYERALALDDRLGACGSYARTLLAWGRTLQRAGNSTANEIVERAASVADEAKVPGVAHEARTLAAALDR